MYLEINLLPKDLRPRKSLLAFNIQFLLGVIAIIGLTGLGGYYYHLTNSVRHVKSQIASLKIQESSYRSVLDKQAEVENIKRDIERRAEIIRELTIVSDTRFDMLKYINENFPHNMWLRGITELNERGLLFFQIEGMSYTKEDISELLKKLELFEGFRRVSLESIAPAPFEVKDAFSFSVLVEFTN